MRALLILLLVAGCTQLPSQWLRLDGKDIDPPRLAADKTICNGEMQKSNVQTPRDAWNRDSVLAEIYIGCMAAKGYKAQP